MTTKALIARGLGFSSGVKYVPTLGLIQAAAPPAPARVLVVLGSYLATLTADGEYGSVLSVEGSDVSAVQTDIVWFRGDHRTLEVLMDADSGSLSGWEAEFTWMNRFGSILLRKTATVTTSSRLLSIELVSTDFSTTTFPNALYLWECWRTDVPAGDAPVAYGNWTFKWFPR